jgi:hypothetical protein
MTTRHDFRCDLKRLQPAFAMTPSSNPAICYFSQKELKDWIDFYQGDSTWLTHDEHPFRRSGTWQNIHQTLNELTVKSI